MKKNMARVELVLVDKDGGMDESIQISMRDLSLIAYKFGNPESPAESEIQKALYKALNWLQDHR